MWRRSLSALGGRCRASLVRGRGDRVAVAVLIGRRPRRVAVRASQRGRRARTSPAASVAPVLEPPIFRLEGEFWTIAFSRADVSSPRRQRAPLHPSSAPGARASRCTSWISWPRSVCPARHPAPAVEDACTDGLAGQLMVDREALGATGCGSTTYATRSRRPRRTMTPSGPLVRARNSSTSWTSSARSASRWLAARAARRDRASPRERVPGDPDVDREDRRPGPVARPPPRPRHPDGDVLLLPFPTPRRPPTGPCNVAADVPGRSGHCSPIVPRG